MQSIGVTMATCNLPLRWARGGGRGITVPREVFRLLTAGLTGRPPRLAPGEKGRGGGEGDSGGDTGGVAARGWDMESRMSTLAPTPSIMSGNICNTTGR